jgi:superfamily I DNA/RNA helicase
LRFLAAWGGTSPEALFFVADVDQCIFQVPFSWKSLGVHIRGRSQTLRIHYRTSHQIHSRADQLLDPELADVDGIMEDWRGAQSVFNGPDPLVFTHASEPAEQQAIATCIRERIADGVDPLKMAIFVRSTAQLPRAEAAAKQAKLKVTVLDHRMTTSPRPASIGTMHLAKGLEFRAIVIMAWDDEILPFQDRIDEIGDDADQEEVYHTERHLLYVACTRARDFLMVLGVEPAPEFLGDLTQRA